MGLQIIDGEYIAQCLVSQPGIYTLILDVACPLEIEVGKLGLQQFNQGLYTYTGSALGKFVTLKTRINHHITFKKRSYWHIDYLLGSPKVAVKVVICIATSLKMECRVVKNIEHLVKAQTPIRGFGSSDCHHGCISHLSYLPTLCIEEVMSLIIKVYKQVFHGIQAITYCSAHDRATEFKANLTKSNLH